MEPEGASCTQNCWYKAVSRSVTGAPFCAPGYGSSWEWGSKGQRPTGVSRLFSLQRNGTGLELGTQGREHPGTCPVGAGGLFLQMGASETQHLLSRTDQTVDEWRAKTQAQPTPHSASHVDP